MSVWTKLFEVEYLVKKALLTGTNEGYRRSVVEMVRVLDIKEPWLEEEIERALKTVSDRVSIID